MYCLGWRSFHNSKEMKEARHQALLNARWVREASPHPVLKCKLLEPENTQLG